MNTGIRRAFTLAEMMVVLLILSLTLAAFLPVITSKSKASPGSIWRYASNNSDIYFGLGATQGAAIGRSTIITDGPGITLYPRLQLDTASDRDIHISLLRSGAEKGRIVALGVGNTGFGTWSMRKLDTANAGFNTSMGGYAFENITTGGGNSAFGYAALRALTTGNHNTAIGRQSLEDITTQEWNTAVGEYSLMNATTVSADAALGNTALGYDANSTLTTADGTIAVGFQTRATANGAISIGTEAITTTDDSIAIGDEAIVEANGVAWIRGIAIGPYSIARGNTATVIGASAQTGTGDNSVAVGVSASAGATTGGNCTAIGGYTIANGSSAIAIGGYNATASASNAIAIGSQSKGGNSYDITMGYYARGNGGSSVIIGNRAGYPSGFAETTGTSIINIGSNAYTADGGDDAIAIGHDARTNAGDNGIAIGLSTTVTGYNPIAIGRSSVASADDTVALGRGSQASSSQVAALGAYAQATASGTTAVGGAAVANISYATAVGNSAHAYGNTSVAVGQASVTNDTYAICVGGDSSATTLGATTVGGNADATGAQATAIGYTSLANASNSTAIGYGAQATTANTIRLGNGSITAIYAAVTSITSSDRRLKNVGATFDDGLNKIRQIQPYNYVLKKDDKKTPRVGIMAQDLKKIFPHAVFTDTYGYLAIRQDDMFYAMINAIKEIDKIVQGLVNDVKSLVARVQQVEDKITAIIKVDNINAKKIKELEDKNKQLEARLKKLEKLVNK